MYNFCNQLAICEFDCINWSELSRRWGPFHKSIVWRHPHLLLFVLSYHCPYRSGVSCSIGAEYFRWGSWGTSDSRSLWMRWPGWLRKQAASRSGGSASCRSWNGSCCLLKVERIRGHCKEYRLANSIESIDFFNS